MIDDSPTQSMMIKIFLEKNGFQVVTADNGMEGINKTYLELPNLIISDIVMPELNGYQLCRLLKYEEFTSHVPIILLTNLGQSQDRFWGIHAGADSFICKESNQQELLNEIWSKGYEEVKLYKYTRQMNGSFIGQPIRRFK